MANQKNLESRLLVLEIDLRLTNSRIAYIMNHHRVNPIDDNLSGAAIWKA